jgi:hypothetical protein
VAAKPKLTLTKVLAPSGDDKLSMKGEATFAAPFSPPLDLVANGVRLIVRDGTDGLVVDATIAGGTYDPVTRTGWRVNLTGTTWTYKAVGTQPQGITTVGLKTIPKTPGLVKFKVKGKNGTYAVDTLNPAVLPLRATLILDPPAATTGQCIELTFPATPPARPSCSVAGPGTVVKCK